MKKMVYIYAVIRSCKEEGSFMKKCLALVMALCLALCASQAALADMLSDIQEKGTLVTV